MAYEKKTEPLTSFETFMAGFTLIVFVFILNVLPWANSSIECVEEDIKLDISSEEDVYKFHDCIKKNRTMFLFGSTLLLLGYPIILSHIHYSNRFQSTLWSFYNIDLYKCIYNGSFIIATAVYCIILPAIIILISYYDWEFAQGYQYQGYALQFQFAHLALVIADCSYIPLGCTAAAPYFVMVCIITGLNNSSHWEISNKNRVKSTGNVFGCPSIGKNLLLLFSIIMGCIPLFGAFLTTFEFKRHGFFSYHGDSQWLYIVFFISWLISGISCIYISCNLDKIKNYMNNIVKSIPLSKKENESDNNNINNNNNNNNEQNPVVPVVPVGPIEPIEPIEPVVPTSSASSGSNASNPSQEDINEAGSNA